MKYIRQSLAIVVALGSIGSAMATVTAEEVKQLGTTLTGLGAEKAANKDGSIPEFTNTPITPPADYKPGNGHYPDPYKDEKPLLRIDAKNMDQYADKLTEGTKTLLKRWPSYRVDVYPTHRTPTYSKWVGENTIKNATRVKLVADGLGVEGAYGGIPFPIPKSGLEVLWNSVLAPKPVSTDTIYAAYEVDANGRRRLNAIASMYHEYPYYDPDRTSMDGQSYYKFLANVMAPAARVGGKNLGWYSIDYTKQDLLLWTYIPGQRRSRLAPETKYDGIAGSQGYRFDELNLYSGPMDRYNFKLVGKKEIYVPYNAYRAVFGATDKVVTPVHINPDALRWELHRVWVVDGTLKSGKSHALTRRTFYADEDTWALLLSDSYDSTGKLSRMGQDLSFTMYEGGNSTLLNYTTVFYNVAKDGYLVNDLFGEQKLSVMTVPKRPTIKTTPERMAAEGVR